MSFAMYLLSLFMFLFPSTNEVIQNKAIDLGNELIYCVIENKEISSKHAVFIGKTLQSTLKNMSKNLKWDTK